MPSAAEAEIVSGILGTGEVVAVASPPSFFDQVHVFATHQVLLGYLEEAGQMMEAGLLSDVAPNVSLSWWA
jgi:hypothetical protein